LEASHFWLDVSALSASNARCADQTSGNENKFTVPILRLEVALLEDIKYNKAPFCCSAGRRTQVAKGEVCKTSIQRFESARRLHEIYGFHILTAAHLRIGFIGM
jgi:hypothetical protein